MAREWNTNPDGKIVVPYNLDINFLSSIAGATIFYWYKGTADAGGVSFSLSNGSTSTDYFTIFMGGNITGVLTNELITLARRSSDFFTFILGYQQADRNELFDGEWHSVAVVSDGLIWDLYIDGVNQALTAGFGANGGEYGSGSNDTVYLGARRISGSDQTSLDGESLAEFAVWNKALIPVEIKKLHTGTRPRDIQRKNLRAYYPLYGLTDTEPDLSRYNHPAVATGTARIDHDIPQPKTRPRTSPFFTMPIVFPPATYLYPVGTGPKLGLRIE